MVDAPRFLGVDLAAARTPADVASPPRSETDIAAGLVSVSADVVIWAGYDPAEQVPAVEAPVRAWRYRLLDYGPAHDGTPRGLAIVEVWHVDGRAIVYRSDPIALFDGRLLDEPIAPAVTRLRGKVGRCVAALSMPVLTLETIVIEHHTDYPSSAELLESPR